MVKTHQQVPLDGAVKKPSKRGRKRINTLWRRKRNLFNKALELSQGCDRQVYIAVRDKKYGGLTEFTDPD